MKLVGSRKFTWGICSIGILLAIVSVFFLPQIISVHFANGIADGFGNKMEVFLFPILLFIITLLTGKEKIKYFLTHSKTFLTDVFTTNERTLIRQRKQHKEKRNWHFIQYMRCLFGAVTQHNFVFFLLDYLSFFRA